jgi:hypothetical protein
MARIRSEAASVRRQGTSKLLNGHVPVWDEATNSFIDGGAVADAEVLTTEASMEHFEVVSTAGQTVFAPASPLSAFIFDEAVVCVKQTVAIGGATKQVLPTAINLSTGAVTIAAAALNDVVHVTWIGVID